MSEFKHTPGPWTVSNYGHALAVECKVDGIEHTVVTDQFCFPNFKQNGDPEKLANASLIAAAPELLEALQMATSLLRLEGWRNEAQMQKMDNAINKALGKETINHA